MEQAHTPGPLTSIKATQDRQYRIESDFHAAEGEWEDVYVNFGGYFGSYGPAMFVAAPDLLNALRLAVRQNSHDMLMTGEELRICEAAIAKAEGIQP